MKRVVRALITLGALYGAYLWLTRGRRPAGPRSERRSVPDPEAMAADAQDSVALDLDRLFEIQSASYRPLADYLTAIRIKRGSEESLLFVRKRDVDQLAALVGATRDEFLENFRQLGVVVSLN